MDEAPNFPTASGDPNDCSQHTDVIREALKAKAVDETASNADREQARAMLAMFFPETALADPNRWQGRGNVTGGVLSHE